jgi:hypothetical protein
MVADEPVKVTYDFAAFAVLAARLEGLTVVTLRPLTLTVMLAPFKPSQLL